MTTGYSQDNYVVVTLQNSSAVLVMVEIAGTGLFQTYFEELKCFTVLAGMFSNYLIGNGISNLTIVFF